MKQSSIALCTHGSIALFTHGNIATSLYWAKHAMLMHKSTFAGLDGHDNFNCQESQY
jgi:hypothetical protein